MFNVNINPRAGKLLNVTEKGNLRMRATYTNPAAVGLTKEQRAASKIALTKSYEDAFEYAYLSTDGVFVMKQVGQPEIRFWPSDKNLQQQQVVQQAAPVVQPAVAVAPTTEA